MTFLWMIIIGSIVAAVSKALMPGRDVAGLMVLGIGGSLMAGAMQYGENQPVDLAASLMGSIILMAVYRMSASTPRVHTPRVQRTSEHDHFRRAA